MATVGVKGLICSDILANSLLSLSVNECIVKRLRLEVMITGVHRAGLKKQRERERERTQLTGGNIRRRRDVVDSSWRANGPGRPECSVPPDMTGRTAAAAVAKMRPTDGRTDGLMLIWLTINTDV